MIRFDNVSKNYGYQQDALRNVTFDVDKGVSALVVLSSGWILGWFGAWISVSVYLRELDVNQKQ